MSLQEKIAEWATHKDQLVIGIDDWLEQLIDLLTKEDEVFPTTVDELLWLTHKHNLSENEAGAICVAAQHKGLLDDDIMPDYKRALQAGNGAHLGLMFRRHRIVTEMNGKEIEHQQFIGRPSKKEDNGEVIHHALYDSDEGIEYARHYLEKVIPSFIRNKLSQLVTAGVDIEPEVKKLRKSISEIVKELS